MQSLALYYDTDEAKEGVHAFEEKHMPSFARFRR
jgi:1,4-dihydroxy-2-naphthoyl-CoA synthase